MLLYVNFSAAQAREKAFKSGHLTHLKRERKMFAPFNVFWLNRSCWVSLVGSHLLLYGSERDSRPYLVESLRGYKGRPAPDALVRDPRRSEAAFEIYCPGDRTFQFLAKSAQEMREWVDAVTQGLGRGAGGSGCGGGDGSRSRAPTFVEILELESNERICIERMREEQEKYQDVFNTPKIKTKEKQSTGKAATDKETAVETKEEVPPLPARTRRLPSLPSQDRLSYEPREELYDEEGLYHRIEDIKSQREYQNCALISTAKEKETEAAAELEQETYDDVQNVEDKSKGEEPTETYDDVQSFVQDKRKDEPISYDDVQTVAENLRTKSEKDSPTKPIKTSQKRSFFDRVRSRKESMKKDDKSKPGAKSPILVISAPTSPTTPPPATHTTTIVVKPESNGALVVAAGDGDEPDAGEPQPGLYDDATGAGLQVAAVRCANGRVVAVPGAADALLGEENYLSPPPPRPIYSRPPTIIKCALPAIGDEIYDDIGASIDLRANGCRGCASSVDVIKDYPKNNSFLSDLQLSIDHYQVPRSGNRRVDDVGPEELYDDVALSETFKNRQRDAPPAVRGGGSTSPASPERSSSSGSSVWSRFGSSKKPRIFDHMMLLRHQSSCGGESTTESTQDESTAGEQQQQQQQHQLSSKVKPLQKLISKVETTLNRAAKTNGLAQN